MSQGTLLDIAKLNGMDKVVGLIEENLTYAPELSIVPGRTIKGTTYKTTSRDSYPGVGFRQANAGVTYGKSNLLNRLFQCYIFSGNIRVDAAVAAAFEDGPAAWMTMESSGVMKQSLINIGAQFFYGVAQDAGGFPGLQAFHTAFGTELTNRSIANIVVDATGTTANTGSSVYGVKFGDQGVQFIFGNGLGLALGPWFDQMVNDGNAGKDYLAHVAAMNAWLGLQAANPYSIGRVKNLTADAGKGLTDSLLEDLLALYPVGYKPDAWFMTRRSRRQLQKSRSVVISSGVPQIQQRAKGQADGQDVIAPEPISACGIPIIVTDSLSNTEAIA